MDWITALWQPAESKPGRILVAGCGTGAEAFTLRRKFPDAAITAVDFSPRSIELSRALQRRARPVGKSLFLVGDLAVRSLATAASMAPRASVSWRRVLRALGYDINRFAEGTRLRRQLKVPDALAGCGPRFSMRRSQNFRERR